MQVFHLGRAPHTKETLPDFLKWRRVTQHTLVFRGLTGSQWTPGFWGVTMCVYVCEWSLLLFITHIFISSQHPVSYLSELDRR